MRAAGYKSRNLSSIERGQSMSWDPERTLYGNKVHEMERNGPGLCARRRRGVEHGLLLRLQSCFALSQRLSTGHRAPRPRLRRLKRVWWFVDARACTHVPNGIIFERNKERAATDIALHCTEGTFKSTLPPTCYTSRITKDDVQQRNRDVLPFLYDALMQAPIVS